LARNQNNVSEWSEAINTNFIVFGLTRPELGPTIYCTRGEYTNHYATDAVQNGSFFILGLNKEGTQRRRVFSFINLKDKFPLIGLRHYLYD
jgi:hypothetical protein